MDKPQYPCKPIGTLDVLASTLGVHPKTLKSIASKVDESYTPFNLPADRKTGKIRTVHDPKHELKKIQKRINSRIFSHVKFPAYLQGGIKATVEVKRDYIENASKHGHCQTLINLDVKDFYPNIKSASVSYIFKQFFRFSDEVVDILTLLTTYNGKLPQGGCTSSYLANLIFFNEEYHLFSSLRGRNIEYTRLLDDITISSTKKIDKKLSTKIIKDVAGMLKKKGLSLKGKKTKIADRSEMHKDFEVTGLCVRDSQPKATKQVRRYIRYLVFKCEQMSKQSKTSADYHTQWNRTSGLIAKLDRLNHSQAKDYRLRLSVILPHYEQYQEDQIIKRTKSALKTPVTSHNKLGIIKRYNNILYHIGILSRTQKGLAKNLRLSLKKHYSSVPTINAFWEK